MKQLLMSLACTAMLMGNVAFAQQNDKDKTKDKKANQQQGQKGQQQTIRGTIAGVTAMGEMAIDPQSREAVVVEADYLAILGTPSQGQSFEGNQNKNQQNQAGKKNKKRQNLYFVAMTPKTKVHWAKGHQPESDSSSKAQGQDKNQSALEDLQIGDRVEVQFSNEQQLHAKSEGSKSRPTTDRRLPWRQKRQETRPGPDLRRQSRRSHDPVRPDEPVRSKPKQKNKNKKNKNKNRNNK